MRVLITSLVTTIVLCSAFDVTTDILFKLYTHQNKNTAQNLTLNDDGASLKSSFFNPEHPTRFVVHGWLNSGDSEVVLLLKEAFLECRKVNVIVVDWGLGTHTLYSVASHRVKSVGIRIAFLIQNIQQYTGVCPSNITVVGHSLGAQVAGFAGKYLKSPQELPILGAVVALDPPSLYYQNSKVSLRLAKGDAKHVQVIRTSFLGMEGEVGDANFFPNYLSGQALQCSGDLIVCSHGMAVKYYAESINKAIYAYKCNSYADIRLHKCDNGEMNYRFGGDPVDTNLEGSFYVMPDYSEAPYFEGPSICKNTGL